ncbi:hypothetical protein EVJ58_g254 [Rhodofomes roseus]|uniref:Zn(2)-C6 fungal-type domain-containing protein n=1 Tax=Rhodofomes roseus TaxID=34475 RepID=A0A4Y9Z7D9_9APHY|nr:hypothetical protein EVJ58_g254 [Rhodofomes roseus]
MPNAVRARDDKERIARAQEQEFKRARGAISCAECRRLKLKCDKTVPCSSCKRRGCSSICPNGSLTTGQGTRFILADTDRLHRKIAEMSDRIRELEDGLSLCQSSISRDPHPLLSHDRLKIKSGLELHSAANARFGDALGEEDDEEAEESKYIDSFGTLAVRDDGAATFYGRSAGSESLLLDEGPTPPTAPMRPPSKGPMLPSSLARLTMSFPAAPSDIPAEDLQELIESYLPPWPRAGQLCDLYLEQAPWFFGAVTRRQLLEEILPLFYDEAAESGALSNTAAAFALERQGGGSSGSSHDLALLFVIFCFGALTDADLPAAPNNPEAERYIQLTRAALNLEPVLDRPPSVVTVQTLSLMGIYQGLVADENSIESTWALMGLSSKLAQSIGLREFVLYLTHRIALMKRRALFWELFITDCWQALATGRLPTFALSFVDTELPADPDETLADDGTPQPSFPAWKARWGKECLSEVVQGTGTPRAPKYTVILELDRKLRDMPLPKYATGPPPEGKGLAETMSHYMPINYLHLIQPVPDTDSKVLGTVDTCILCYSSVVTHGGTTKTAQAALGELRLAYDLFENAAKYGGRAVKFLPVVRRLHDKAYATYTQGIPPARDIFTPRVDAKQHDELQIFSGRTRTVATKSHTQRARSVSKRRPGASSSTPSSSSGPISPDSMTSPGSGAGSGRSSESPQAASVEMFPALESYGGEVHPMLVDEMRGFQGALDNQIRDVNAYYMSKQEAARLEEQARFGGVQQTGPYHTPPDYPSPPQQFDHSQAFATSHGYEGAECHEDQHGYSQCILGVPLTWCRLIRNMQPFLRLTRSRSRRTRCSIPVSMPMRKGITRIPPVSAAPAMHGQGYHANMPPPPPPPATRSQLWQVPPGHIEHKHLYSPTTPVDYPHPAQPAPSYGHVPTPSLSRNSSMTQMRQHPHPSMPPHQQQPVMAAHYSLQETWNSFMQHQLPAAPVPQPPSQGYGGPS